MEHEGDSAQYLDGSDRDYEQRNEARGAGGKNSCLEMLSNRSHSHQKSKLDFNAVDSVYRSGQEEDGTLTRKPNDDDGGN